MRSSMSTLAVLFSLSTLHVQAVAAQSPYRLDSAPWSRTAPLTGGPFGMSWRSRLFTGLGGALVGAGLGFFASQVHIGDWDDPSEPVDRPAWAAVGGSLGFAMGFSFPLGGRSRRGPEFLMVDRDVILGEEVRQLASVTNAYDAVRALRPEWLVLRGTASWRETPRGTMSSTENTVDLDGAELTLRAYLDGVPLGGVDGLREITPESIRTIRFIAPEAATARWGTGHAHGAILVLTR